MKIKELKVWTFVVVWKHKHLLTFCWLDTQGLIGTRADWMGGRLYMWLKDDDIKIYWKILNIKNIKNVKNNKH